MIEKHLLLTGRLASGKTEVLIAFVNRFAKTTLFVWDEMNEEILRIRGLDKKLIKPSDKPQPNHLKQKKW